MEKYVTLLQQYGSCVTTVALAWALIKFYADFKKTINAKDELIRTMNEDHHGEVVAVVRECTAIMTTLKNTLDRVEKHIEGDDK